MDKFIPAGAAILLQFIYETEVSRPSPECYNVIYGHNQDKLAKPLTQMTIKEIQAAQPSWTKKFGSSATGAYQFMYATLKNLILELKLLPSQKFDGDLQDRLGYHLLKRRGYTEYMAGKISRAEFGKRLAQEWASFPVLANVRGATRNITRGQSYYAGDGLNKSLVKPETVEKILDKVKAAGNVSPAKPAPKEAEVTHILVDVVETATDKVADKVTEKATKSIAPYSFAIAGIIAGFVTLVTGFAHWLSALPCNILGLACGN